LDYVGGTAAENVFRKPLVRLTKPKAVVFLAIPWYLCSNQGRTSEESSLRDSLWKLDFSDLGAKGVGYASHQSPLKEVSDAHPTAQDGTGVGPLLAMGLDQHKRFHHYHRVLSHAS
jgi:hypothetical protein